MTADKRFGQYWILIDLRVYSQQEFSLVCSNPACIHPFHQSGVFVDQPRLPEDVGRSVFQLKHKYIFNEKKIIHNNSIQIIQNCTRFVSWVSIMKLWTCFSALDSSIFRDTTATRRAVHPAPWKHHLIHSYLRPELVVKIKSEQF